MSRNIPPNLLQNLEAISSIIHQPNLGLVVDFDGTLSELVPVPDDATIHLDAVEPLRVLSRKLTLTAVVSGRPARDLQSRVGIAGIWYVGNHGAEYTDGGEVTVVGEAVQTSLNIEEFFDRIRPAADGPGVVWENKDFSGAIHYRMAPDKEDARKRILAVIEQTPEFEEHEVLQGNMVFEIRARTGINKGYAIKRLHQQENVQGMIFIGDDTTDADAMNALNELHNQGKVEGLSIVAVQEGTPDVVLDAASYSLNGVKEVTLFLEWLSKESL